MMMYVVTYGTERFTASDRFPVLEQAMETYNRMKDKGLNASVLIERDGEVEVLHRYDPMKGEETTNV